VENANVDEAALRFSEGMRCRESGDLRGALAALRQAVLLYAAAEGETAARVRGARAEACARFADCLAEADEHAYAANIYQEATDLYTQLTDPDAAEQAHVCARSALASIAALRARPQERLYLLIAHYERQQQQLALEPGTERQQAEQAAYIARVFQRRERYEESIARYREALDLYGRAPQPVEVMLARAECHHRIATMLHRYVGDLPGAARSYRSAIALYTEYEPPVYGVQQSRDLCLLALAEIEPWIGSGEAALELPPEPFGEE
jgi:tetratricopeptide (TPR) repeat protein